MLEVFVDAVVLCWCLPLQKYTISSMNVTKAVLFSVKNGVAEKHFCHSYHTVLLFSSGRKGWGGRSVDLRIAFMLIFFAFSWFEGNLCLQLGLTCSCMSYLTRKTCINCRICTRDVRSHILYHMHNCNYKWQIGHILYLVLKFGWTQPWDSIYLAIFVLFYSSVQMKGFERMLKLEGRWQEQCTLCLSYENGK